MRRRHGRLVLPARLLPAYGVGRVPRRRVPWLRAHVSGGSEVAVAFAVTVRLRRGVTRPVTSGRTRVASGRTPVTGITGVRGLGERGRLAQPGGLTWRSRGLGESGGVPLAVSGRRMVIGVGHRSFPQLSSYENYARGMAPESTRGIDPRTAGLRASRRA